MKQLIQQFVRRGVSNEAVWRALDATILRPTRLVEEERRRVVLERRGEDALVASAIARTCPDLVVRHGPFAGMRYPTADTVYSALFPKLLGSYERELSAVIERVCAGDYTKAVDVGCAEGYYAVGLALRLPRATVHAFDTDPRARTLCHTMAALNRAGSRVVVGAFCGPDTLRELCLGQRTLVLVDCEGFETKLLTPETVSALDRSDVLVEAHDFVDITISDRVRSLFRQTHDVISITSVDDIIKARTYSYSELETYDLPSRRTLLAERRPTIMEWLFMTPKATAWR